MFSALVAAMSGLPVSSVRKGLRQGAAFMTRVLLHVLMADPAGNRDNLRKGETAGGRCTLIASGSPVSRSASRQPLCVGSAH